MKCVLEFTKDDAHIVLVPTTKVPHIGDFLAEGTLYFLGFG